MLTNETRQNMPTVSVLANHDLTMSEDNSTVQSILAEAMHSAGALSSMRREGSTLSVASLPATIMMPKPFKSKIPTPKVKRSMA